MLSTKNQELPMHLYPLSHLNKVYVNKLSAFYGPNAAGKSNILKAYSTMCNLINVLGISRKNENKLNPYSYEPFTLSSKNQDEPTLFQSIFETKNYLFRYGFTYKSNIVVKEWLYILNNQARETLVFNREGLKVNWGRTRKHNLHTLKPLEAHLSETNLLLSIGADLKNEICSEASSFFNLIYLDNNVSIDSFKNDISNELLQILSNLIYLADTGIENLQLKDDILDDSTIPNDIPDYFKKFLHELSKDTNLNNKLPRKKILFKHKSENNEQCFFEIKDESVGTVAFLRIAIALCIAIIEERMVCIDELDQSLHPLLVAKLLYMFTLIKSNKAQLLFTSHSPYILSNNIIRLDEIWLVEKDRDGQTKLECAADYKDIRENSDFANQYLSGKFGAIPIFNNLKINKFNKEISNLSIEK